MIFCPFFSQTSIIMRYKVPQDVQREDHILWILTLKQLVIILIGGGLSYLIFVNLKKEYDLNEVENILIWLPLLISVAFAFLKIKGISLTKFILLLIEQNVFRLPKRHWCQGGGEPFVSMTTTFSMSDKKKEATVGEAKEVSQEKIKNLAKLLDGEKKTD